MELTLGILQVVAIYIVPFAVVGFVIAGFFLLWDRRASSKRRVAQLVCRLDTDCPSGYVCRNGVCVPAKRWRIKQ